VLANPFKHFDSVYPQVVAAAQKERVDDRKNLTFHRQTMHPLVDKSGPTMAPGWNHSNDEITANGRHGCYVVFDRDGQLVFQGRLTFDEVEDMVARLVRR